MAEAISFVVPRRFNGRIDSHWRRAAAGSGARATSSSTSGVAVVPGQTQFTRIPRGAKSTAQLFVSSIIAAFETLYATWLRMPTSPASDETLTIAPLVFESA